jgi:translation initiation factor 6
MATRLQFENSNEIGCFATLTNSYCIVAPVSASNKHTHLPNTKPLFSFLISSASTHINQIYLQFLEKGSSENFNSAFEAELADHIPVVKCSIAGTRVIGRTIVGETPILYL